MEMCSPLDMSLGGPHHQSGCCGKEKKSLLCPYWESNPSP